MGKWRPFLAAIAIAILASIVITKCFGPPVKAVRTDPDKSRVEARPTVASAPAIADVYQEGYVDLSHEETLFSDRCEHNMKEYDCRWVGHNGKTYVRVFDDDGNEIYQLRPMPNGKLKEIWSRGESV